MATRPRPTPIFHITHVENVASIVSDRGLLSDAAMIARGGPRIAVGLTEIKSRRMNLPVKCHSGDKVGEYVPFFFCPRSIMLYIFRMDNMPGLSYHGGQEPIVHLELDAERVIAWADSEAVNWAFTTANAAAAYTPFFRKEEELDAVDWEAVAANDFRDSRIKDGKQAEFLVKRFVPWDLVERVGTRSEEVRAEALAAISGSDHQPRVEVCRDWYF